MYQIDEKTDSFMLDFVLQETWEDVRIQKLNLTSGKITLPHFYVSKIWVPDNHISNEKYGYLHIVTEPNIGVDFEGGNVTIRFRYTMRLQCVYNMTRFPFEVQLCEIYFESYGYSTEDNIYEMDNPAYLFGDRMILPEFNITDVDFDDCSYSGATGTFSCKKMVMSMQRLYGTYFTQTFVPSILVVVISWFAFWVNYRQVAARVAMGVLPITTLQTIESAASSRLPAVSYVMSIDIWLNGCKIFLVCAFLQYAALNICIYLLRGETIVEDLPEKKRKKREEMNSSEDGKNKNKSNNMNTNNHNYVSNNHAKKRKKMKNRPDEVPLIAASDTSNASNNAINVNNNMRKESTTSSTKQREKKESLIDATGKRSLSIIDEEVLIRRAREREDVIAYYMDVFCRGFFPFSFFLFNLFYWPLA